MTPANVSFCASTPLAPPACEEPGPVQRPCIALRSYLMRRVRGVKGTNRDPPYERAEEGEGTPNGEWPVPFGPL